MTYKESFIKFMVDSGVLKFGEFTLKSGRLAPATTRPVRSSQSSASSTLSALWRTV